MHPHWGTTEGGGGGGGGGFNPWTAGWFFQNEILFLMMFIMNAIFWYETGPVKLIFYQQCGSVTDILVL